MSRRLRWALDEDGEEILFAPTVAMHTIVAGATRSGKSKLSQAILVQLARCPEVAVCGVDPAGGLLAPFARLRPEDVVVGSGIPALENAVKLIDHLVEVMEQRNMGLLDRLEEKMDHFSPECPLIVVVLEEYAGMLAALEAWDKKRQKGFVLQVGRLLREGAKAGIRVFTVIQRPEAAVLHDRAQYSRRISCRLDNADSVRMLFEDASAPVVARLVNVPPGQGLVWEAGSPPRWFQAPDLNYARYCELIFDRYRGPTLGLGVSGASPRSLRGVGE
ncbi:FtsK/SpoIIIE domain-containing protein [Corynebacterium oculi]|uniref:FtsK/SpoIIIE family protein n=1 Tax=Corynebacterium oculi TaxID=1544416 RepID=A0A0Q0UEM3_9CORY|nr:FtsK/SpoIIIE domain-containing protein [Corynebacterium oculi]KQB85133.1 FtsK/SpoIIIE family protein [Corynebacterium oculi]